MTVVAGLDGCAGGWLCLWGEAEGGPVYGRILCRLAELAELVPAPAVVGADIPIGLSAAGPRACDRAARRFLGRGRGSSVFPAPIRPMLAAGSYAEACAVGQRTDGRKLSRQTWNILPKIREMDDFLAADPARAGWVREVHPEVSFAAWNGGTPMAHNKKTAAGAAERRALIEAGFGDAPATVAAALPAEAYVQDDLLDAFAVLWSARRIATGAAFRLPEVPASDERGLAMEIVA